MLQILDSLSSEAQGTHYFRNKMELWRFRKVIIPVQFSKWVIFTYEPYPILKSHKQVYFIYFISLWWQEILNNKCFESPTFHRLVPRAGKFKISIDHISEALIVVERFSNEQNKHNSKKSAQFREYMRESQKSVKYPWMIWLENGNKMIFGYEGCLER